MADPRRAAIVQAALAEVGPGDVPKYWASCGLPADTHASWCGAFTLFCLHQAGLAEDVKWLPGLGYAGPQHLAITKTPQPGDLFYKDQPWQHYGVVESFDPVTGALTSIEGNSPHVARFVHDHPTGVVYYSIDKFLGGTSQTPVVSPVVSSMLLGVDVSHHNPPGSIDYAALAKTHKFIVARGTYGEKIDETFATHVQCAQDAGLVCGAYHFWRASQDNDAQLDAFDSVVGAAGMGPGWLPPVVDLEQNLPDGPTTTDHYAPARDFAEKLRDKYGACMIYTSVGFWSQIGNPEWIKDHLLWVAHWNVQFPTTPFGMPFVLWQHHVGVLPGVAPGPLDQNVAHSLPLLKDHDPAAPLLLTVDWDSLRADRDAMIREEDA